MKKKIDFPDQQSAMALFGPNDIYLRQLCDAFDVKIVSRGDSMVIQGGKEEVEACFSVVSKMREMCSGRQGLSRETVAELIDEPPPPEGRAGGVELSGFGDNENAPEARTEGQARYMEAMIANDIVFCIGPAGTGKTYLAVAVALDYLKRGELKRIILCRPAVEAGEHLGYLPGDLRSKVNPYLRPLYDALHDFIPRATLESYIENDLVEILPLAFVRGRTLDKAFIILDEAQNCTVGQMKTFLTRLGSTAKLVATGDITQIDLSHSQRSGLVDVQERLEGIRGIAFVRLTKRDIVRHRLVRQIVSAYQRGSGAGEVKGNEKEQ